MTFDEGKSYLMQPYRNRQVLRDGFVRTYAGRGLLLEEGKVRFSTYLP